MFKNNLKILFVLMMSINLSWSQSGQRLNCSDSSRSFSLDLSRTYGGNFLATYSSRSINESFSCSLNQAGTAYLCVSHSREYKAALIFDDYGRPSSASISLVGAYDSLIAHHYCRY
jgi:hypothetical protein